MRISAGRSWLAVAALALGTAEAAIVNFTNGFEGSWEPTTRAIILLETGINKTFYWTTTANVIVDEINLWTFEDDTQSRGEIWLNTGKRTGFTTILPTTTRHPAWTPTSSNPAQNTLGNPGGNQNDGRDSEDHHRLRNRQQAPRRETLQFQSSNSGGAVTLGWEGITPGKPLWFEAIWSNGQSYSRLFTLVANGEQRDNLWSPDRFSNMNTQKEESGTPAGPSSNDDQSPQGGDGQPSGTTGSGGSETTNSVAKSSGGGGGLSSGAVIGIAVACGVVGLILVFALVWFLLRRRQQNKAMHPVDSSYGSGNRTDELMAEKEAGADVDVTPHSPYSDEGASAAGPSGTYQDGTTAHGEAVAAGAVAAAHHPHQQQQDQARSFTPYSDRPSAGAAGTPSVRAASVAQTDEVRVSVPSATPGRATPRALTTPYAHLVEEGMTEEEIRRLEDEERQLDAAIEQAGRR